MTDLARTKHDLKANGGNAIHHDKNESRAWYNDSRIRGKLVDMENGSVAS